MNKGKILKITENTVYIGYEDGSLKAEKFYKNGKLQGINRIYYPNGKLQTEANFKENNLDGILKEYDESGKIIKEVKNNGFIEE